MYVNSLNGMFFLFSLRTSTKVYHFFIDVQLYVRKGTELKVRLNSLQFCLTKLNATCGLMEQSITPSCTH